MSKSLSIRYEAIQDIVVEDSGGDETPRYVYEAATVTATEILYNLCVFGCMGLATSGDTAETAQLAEMFNSFNDEAVAWEANHPTKMMDELRQRCGVPRPDPKSALSPPYCYGVLAQSPIGRVANVVATPTASSDTAGTAS